LTKPALPKGVLKGDKFGLKAVGFAKPGGVSSSEKNLLDLSLLIKGPWLWK